MSTQNVKEIFIKIQDELAIQQQQLKQQLSQTISMFNDSSELSITPTIQFFVMILETAQLKNNNITILIHQLLSCNIQYFFNNKQCFSMLILLLQQLFNTDLQIKQETEKLQLFTDIADQLIKSQFKADLLQDKQFIQILLVFYTNYSKIFNNSQQFNLLTKLQLERSMNRFFSTFPPSSSQFEQMLNNQFNAILLSGCVYHLINQCQPTELHNNANYQDIGEYINTIQNNLIQTPIQQYDKQTLTHNYYIVNQQNKQVLSQIVDDFLNQKHQTTLEIFLYMHEKYKLNKSNFQYFITTMLLYKCQCAYFQNGLEKQSIIQNQLLFYITFLNKLYSNDNLTNTVDNISDKQFDQTLVYIICIVVQLFKQYKFTQTVNRQILNKQLIVDETVDQESKLIQQQEEIQQIQTDQDIINQLTVFIDNQIIKQRKFMENHFIKMSQNINIDEVFLLEQSKLKKLNQKDPFYFISSNAPYLLQIEELVFPQWDDLAYVISFQIYYLLNSLVDKLVINQFNMFTEASITVFYDLLLYFRQYFKVFEIQLQYIYNLFDICQLLEDVNDETISKLQQDIIDEIMSIPQQFVDPNNFIIQVKQENVVKACQVQSIILERITQFSYFKDNNFEKFQQNNFTVFFASSFYLIKDQLEQNCELSSALYRFVQKIEDQKIDEDDKERKSVFKHFSVQFKMFYIDQNVIITNYGDFLDSLINLGMKHENTLMKQMLFQQIFIECQNIGKFQVFIKNILKETDDQILLEIVFSQFNHYKLQILGILEKLILFQLICTNKHNDLFQQIVNQQIAQQTESQGQNQSIGFFLKESDLLNNVNEFQSANQILNVYKIDYLLNLFQSSVNKYAQVTKSQSKNCIFHDYNDLNSEQLQIQLQQQNFTLYLQQFLQQENQNSEDLSIVVKYLLNSVQRILKFVQEYKLNFNQTDSILQLLEQIFDYQIRNNNISKYYVHVLDQFHKVIYNQMAENQQQKFVSIILQVIDQCYNKNTRLTILNIQQIKKQVIFQIIEDISMQTQTEQIIILIIQQLLQTAHEGEQNGIFVFEQVAILILKLYNSSCFQKSKIGISQLKLFINNYIKLALSQIDTIDEFETNTMLHKDYCSQMCLLIYSFIQLLVKLQQKCEDQEYDDIEQSYFTSTNISNRQSRMMSVRCQNEVGQVIQQFSNAQIQRQKQQQEELEEELKQLRPQSKLVQQETNEDETEQQPEIDEEYENMKQMRQQQLEIQQKQQLESQLQQFEEQFAVNEFQTNTKSDIQILKEIEVSLNIQNINKQILIYAFLCFSQHLYKKQDDQNDNSASTSMYSQNCNSNNLITNQILNSLQTQKINHNESSKLFVVYQFVLKSGIQTISYLSNKYMFEDEPTTVQAATYVNSGLYQLNFEQIHGDEDFVSLVLITNYFIEKLNAEDYDNLFCQQIVEMICISLKICQTTQFYFMQIFQMLVKLWVNCKDNSQVVYKIYVTICLQVCNITYQSAVFKLLAFADEVMAYSEINIKVQAVVDVMRQCDFEASVSISACEIILFILKQLCQILGKYDLDSTNQQTTQLIFYTKQFLSTISVLNDDYMMVKLYLITYQYRLLLLIQQKYNKNNEQIDDLVDNIFNNYTQIITTTINTSTNDNLKQLENIKSCFNQQSAVLNQFNSIQQQIRTPRQLHCDKLISSESLKYFYQLQFTDFDQKIYSYKKNLLNYYLLQLYFYIQLQLKMNNVYKKQFYQQIQKLYVQLISQIHFTDLQQEMSLYLFLQFFNDNVLLQYLNNQQDQQLFNMKQLYSASTAAFINNKKLKYWMFKFLTFIQQIYNFQ